MSNRIGLRMGMGDERKRKFCAMAKAEAKRNHRRPTTAPPTGRTPWGIGDNNYGLAQDQLHKKMDEAERRSVKFVQKGAEDWRAQTCTFIDLHAFPYPNGGAHLRCHQSDFFANCRSMVTVLLTMKHETTVPCLLMINWSKLS